MVPPNTCNKIIHGDCVDVLRDLPEGCIPVTVTSPPYDGMRKFGGHKFRFEEIAEAIVRVMAPGGLLAWVVQDAVVKGLSTGTSFRQRSCFQELGLNYVQTIVMAVNGGRFPHRTYYSRRHHDALVFANGKPRYVHVIADRINRTAGSEYHGRVRHANGGLRDCHGGIVRTHGDRGDVWHYSVGGFLTSLDAVAREHPALMAEAMAEDLIIAYSRPGDLVLDPMCGAATTCKMAHLNNRRYLGVEIHEPYVEIAEKRMAIAKRQHLDELMFNFQEGLRK